jgi:N,N'-diacetylchitobiose transport system permease protein
MRPRHFAAFVAPTVLVMAVLLVLPLVYTVVWSFQDVTYGSPGRWVGLANYLDPFASPRFRDALVFTVVFTVVVTVLLLVVGYGLALLLSAATRRLRSLFLGLLLVPYVVPLVVGALAFAWIFDDAYGGPANFVLAGIGIDVQWLAEPWPARVLVVLNTVWSQAAFPALILLAGLQTVPDEHVEAARIDGASWAQVQRYVVIPHLRRLFLLITVISVMDSLRVFDQIKMITPSAQNLGTESILVYVYDVALGESQQLGLASAISVMTMLLTFVILIPLLRENSREVREQ